MGVNSQVGKYNHFKCLDKLIFFVYELTKLKLSVDHGLQRPKSEAIQTKYRLKRLIKFEVSPIIFIVHIEFSSTITHQLGPEGGISLSN